MSRSGVSHRGRWSLGYRPVWVGIYVVDARGYCLGNVERMGQARRRVVGPEQVVLKGEIGLFQWERRDISDDFRTGRVAVAMGIVLRLMETNTCTHSSFCVLSSFVAEFNFSMDEESEIQPSKLSYLSFTYTIFVVNFLGPVRSDKSFQA